ncbi:hypothetical protein ACSHXN_14455 [Streptomyces sp. HUAS TT11]|uniref:hypothetical protein n=1 Tax=Streptomyces sp. HUAS TT11 TaxID=3447508 RepID=UPI003F65E89B
MIPVIDLDVDPSLPTDLILGLPVEGAFDEEGYGFFRDVWAVGHVSHEEAVAMLKEEGHLLSLADQASTNHAEFEAVAKALETREAEYLPSGFAAQHPDSEIMEVVAAGDEDGTSLGALELGVAGLTYALTSIGCFTAASCRSHCSDSSWSDRPVIFFAAERSTVQWLAPLVQQTGCGFDDGSERGECLLVVEAPSIANFMDLADRIVRQVDQQTPSILRSVSDINGGSVDVTRSGHRMGEIWPSS